MTRKALAHVPLALALAGASFGGGCPADETCEGDACAVLPAFQSGTVANDVAFSTCPGARVALVPASGEGLLITHLLPTGEALASATFPNVDDRGASPWAVAATADGTRAVVSLFGQDAVALVDPCSGEVLDVKPVDGQTAPEPVVVIGRRAFVGFTNIETLSLDPEVPSVFGEGSLAVFDIEGDALVEVEVRALPGCTNPQGLLASDGDVIVSCSGVLARGPNGGQVAVSDGAILVGSHVIHAARTAPGTPSIVDGFIVVGSLVEPVILVAALTDDELHEGLRLDGPTVDSIFEVVTWDADTAIAVQFSADALHGLKVGRDGSLTIEKTLLVGPGGVAFRGAQAIDIDFDAAEGTVDSLVLLGLSAEIVPLQLKGVWK